MTYSPVAVFAYNRINELKRTIESLANNFDADKTDVFVFLNAPIPEKRSDTEKVSECKCYLESFNAPFNKFELITRDKNNGPNDNMLRGISYVLSQYDRVIVLEDDIITAQSFILFMNHALDAFDSRKEIFSVCAYNPVSRPTNFCGDGFLYPAFRSWGWSIWRDRWDDFRGGSLGDSLLERIDVGDVHVYSPLYVTGLQEDISYGNGYYERFLDLKLFYTQMANGKYVFYSKRSLCDNIGISGNGLTIKKKALISNENFSINDDQSDFDFSYVKLTPMVDPEYFFEFRNKEFIMDLFRDINFNRDRLYLSFYHTFVKVLLDKNLTYDFFDLKEIHSIAIYGFDEPGRIFAIFVSELGLDIKYVIDRKGSNLDNCKYPVYQSYQDSIYVDAVIVTALRDYLDIQEKLFYITKTPVLDMNDIMTEMIKNRLGK